MHTVRTIGQSSKMVIGSSTANPILRKFKAWKLLIEFLPSIDKNSIESCQQLYFLLSCCIEMFTCLSVIIISVEVVKDAKVCDNSGNNCINALLAQYKVYVKGIVNYT